MKKKSIVAILLLLMTFTLAFTSVGCGNAKYEKYYKMCIEDLKDSVRDPDSLKIYSADAYYYTNSDGELVWVCKIVWDAKNAYGAYTGKETSYYKYIAEDKEVSCSSYYSTTYSLAESAKDKHVVYKK